MMYDNNYIALDILIKSQHNISLFIYLHIFRNKISSVWTCEYDFVNQIPPFKTHFFLYIYLTTAAESTSLSES